MLITFWNLKIPYSLQVQYKDQATVCNGFQHSTNIIIMFSFLCCPCGFFPAAQTPPPKCPIQSTFLIGTAKIHTLQQRLMWKIFLACPWGKLQLRFTCPELILTCPEFEILLCEATKCVGFKNFRMCLPGTGEADRGFVAPCYNLSIAHSCTYVTNFYYQIWGTVPPNHVTFGSSKNTILFADMIATIPSQLELEDIEDFCSLAQYYASHTPQSFRKVCIITQRISTDSDCCAFPPESFCMLLRIPFHCGLIANRCSQANQDFSCVRNMNCY